LAQNRWAEKNTPRLPRTERKRGAEEGCRSQT
jgi:hypothetical protein